MRFEFRKWLTEAGGFHQEYNKGVAIPMRVMCGQIVKKSSSGRMAYIEVHGKPEPSVKCLHCNRKLTNEVSMLYGIGPVCGQHFYKHPFTGTEIEHFISMIRAALKATTWSGWVPLDHVEISYESEWTLDFIFNSQRYQVTTRDETKYLEIKRKADEILRETVKTA